jgi:hypothetical protein
MRVRGTITSLEGKPGSMMTNARVTAVVQATSGRELTLSYKDGSQKIVVPEGAPVVTAVPADRSALKPGELRVLRRQRGGRRQGNPHRSDPGKQGRGSPADVMARSDGW